VDDPQSDPLAVSEGRLLAGAERLDLDVGDPLVPVADLEFDRPAVARRPRRREP